MECRNVAAGRAGVLSLRDNHSFYHVEAGDEGVFSFYGAPEDLDTIRKALTEREWDIQVAELSYVPTNITDINEEQTEEVHKLLELLEDNDDAHRVYASLK